MQQFVTHPGLKQGVEARAYQLEAAKDCLSGSTLLVMPTGLGKTAVQWMAMAENLNGSGKIVLVAPTTGLVAQQAKMAKQFVKIDESKIITLTGQDRPQKRQELWQDAKIIMATPHVIRNDAMNGRILLSDIDLLIFDEAHHATGANSMAQLGDLYLEASPNAMVLAATASPGVKAKNVLEVVQRLGIERLNVTKRDDDLVVPYVTEMSILEHRLTIPESLQSIILPLKILENEEAEFLRRAGFLVWTGKITTASIEEAQRRVSAAIGRGDVRGYDAAKRISDLRRLHRLIDLLETQGLRCGLMYLDRARNDKDRKTKRFLSLPQVADLISNCKDSPELHPKPSLVKKLVDEGLSKGGKIIIFTEYRDTVNNLLETLESENVKPGRFVGQASKGKQIGMKQSEQIEQLERFKNGEINVLIATSVGEEGLDVPAADCVILYEPVPSAIRAIQRRGRTARKTDGDVQILIAQNTRDEYVQNAAKSREKSMYKTLSNLQKQSRLPKRMVPKENVLENFTIGDTNAEQYISTEKKRLTVEVQLEKQSEDTPRKKIKSDATIQPNRPKSQKSLADFSDAKKETNWWKPVLDGTVQSKRDDELSSIKATEKEINEINDSNSKPLIVIDHREANSTLPSLIKMNGHGVKFERLPVGDIKISERVLIERKTARDLIDSIIDGRIMKQSRRLANSAIRPLIIIESIESDRIHPNAVMGAMAWITLDLGLPILMTKGVEDTARFVSIAANREAKVIELLMKKLAKSSNKPELSAIQAASSEINSIISGENKEGDLSKKWKNEVVKSRISLLANLPGIGMKTAEQIMNHAGDFMGLCKLSKEELTNIEGVSSIQASELHKFLHGISRPDN